MKNLFLLVLFVMTLTANVFAVDKNKAAKKETGASYFAKNNFSQKFPEIKDATWSNVDSYYKASFVTNGVKKSAFFDTQGEFIATTQYVNADKLPAESLTRLKKLYKDYAIGEVLHFDVESSTDPSSSGSYYFVSLRKADSQIVVKVSAQNEISYFKSL